MGGHASKSDDDDDVQEVQQSSGGPSIHSVDDEDDEDENDEDGEGGDDDDDDDEGEPDEEMLLLKEGGEEIYVGPLGHHSSKLIEYFELSIKEAFRICRYEWMRKALEQFLRVMAEVSFCDDDDDDDIDEGVQVKVVEMMTGSEDQMKGEELPSSDSTMHPLPQAASSSDVEHVVAECKIVSSNCYIKPVSSSASQMVISVHCHGQGVAIEDI